MSPKDLEPPTEPNTLTVGELIRHLQGHDQNKPVIFGCDELDFYRVKDRGDQVQIEFGQTVYLNEENVVVVEHHGFPRVSAATRAIREQGAT